MNDTITLLSQQVPVALTQGMYAIVDAEDYPNVSLWKWYASRCGDKWYARRTYTDAVTGKRTSMYMHRFLLPGVAEVDHRNGNGLNNTRANLREATHQQNCFNRGANRSSESNQKGVCWDKSRGRWKAHIRVNGIKHNLGRFLTKQEAIECHRDAEKAHAGEFAYSSRGGI